MRGPKLLEKRPLFDTKFVLFINNHELQITKLYVILYDSVCTDHNVNQSRLQFLFDFLLLASCNTPREQPHLHSQWMQQGHKIVVMLDRKHLNRHKQSTLSFELSDYIICTYRCYNRLTASHISLQ